VCEEEIERSVEDLCNFCGAAPH